MNIVAEIQYQGEACAIVKKTDITAGDSNAGDGNVGNWNAGNMNAGNMNVGNSNVGDWNAGNMNVGNWNVGNRNVGDWNAGDSNAGDGNAGNWNAGNMNAGNMNAGNWNAGNMNVGFFNTKDSSLMFFNKPTNLTIKDICCIFPKFLRLEITKFITQSDMTVLEKQENPTYQTTGGYLKTYEYKEAARMSWDKTSREDREKTLKLPNFDNEVFEEIFGIDVIKELSTMEK